MFTASKNSIPESLRESMRRSAVQRKEAIVRVERQGIHRTNNGGEVLMKLRSGFVSNSSSSSFVIKKANLWGNDEEQIRLIKEHIEISKQLAKISPILSQAGKDELSDYDKWGIIETDETIQGHTIMDNFDMEWYLVNVVQVAFDDIEWER